MLLDLGMTPGKEMGKVIQESFELQLNGEIKNANEALEFAKNKLAISIWKALWFLQGQQRQS